MSALRVRRPHPPQHWWGGLLLLLTMWGTASHAFEPKGFQALYKVKADGIPLGRMERSLERLSGDEYLLQTKMYTTGMMAMFRKESMSEQSRFRYIQGHLSPLSYHYLKQGGGDERVEQVLFGDTIRSSYKDSESIIEPRGDEYDKLGYQFEIRAALARGEQSMSYRVIKQDEVVDYRFEVKGYTQLETPVGSLKTVIVERTDDPKRVTRFWCAIDHDYILVQIEQDSGSHTFSSSLLELAIP